MKFSSFASAFSLIVAPLSASAFASGTSGTTFLTSSAPTFRAPGALFAGKDDDGKDDDEDGPPYIDASESYLEGNRREPTAREISIMDDMITKLANAEVYELPNAVSKSIRVVSSPKFFMRIAERVDMTTDALEKVKLSSLSENIAATLSAVVTTAEDRMDERAKTLEDVVKAASELDTGEFLVPLSSERVDAMREAMSGIDPSELDEGFLSTVDAWMNKSHEDGMDGMVTILQKVLQIYAGTEISRARARLQANVGAAVSGQSQGKADEMIAKEENEGPSPAAVLLEKLMAMDTDDWDAELGKHFEASTKDEEGGVSPKGILGEVQRTIEGVVLGLENGSMAQRVQAEFLRELVSRIEILEQQIG